MSNQSRLEYHHISEANMVAILRTMAHSSELENISLSTATQEPVQKIKLFSH